MKSLNQFVIISLVFRGVFKPVPAIEYKPAPSLKRFTKKRPVATPPIIYL